MKINLLLLTAVALIAFGCNSGGVSSSTVNNEFLAEFPSMEKNYVNQIEAKEKAVKECTNMEESFKLTKELELLKDERKAKIEAYVTATPLDKSLPFEALPGTPYTLTEVNVNKASSGNLNIKFSLTINEDIKNQYGGVEKVLFVYYKAVDSSGADIPNSKTVATNFNKVELVAGLEYEAFGSWQTKAIINMENFAKVVEITREEYDKK